MRRRWRLTGSAGLIAAAVAAAVVAVPGTTLGPVPAPARAAPSPSPSPRVSPLVGLLPPVGGGRAARPRVRGRAAILVRLGDDRVLYERNPDAELPIASLTKIMTARLVLQATTPSERVRISRLAAEQPPTSLGLKAGQRWTVRPLLEGLLLHSANDAAVALAQRVSGTVGGFLALMNRRARSLGLTRTHFASPSGLDNHGYSTARDVAIMTIWAMRSPAFARLVGEKDVIITYPPSGRHHKLRRQWFANLNWMLANYPGATGVKTGFTDKAMWSIAATARRHGVGLLAVVLGDRLPPFQDASRLLSWGFRRT